MKTFQIFFASPVEDLNDYYQALKIVKKSISHLSDFKINLIEAGNLTAESFFEEVKTTIQTSDLIITHLSKDNSNGMYGIAVAHTLDKANILLIDDESNLPYGIHSLRYITYNEQAIKKSDEAENNISTNLANLIRQALKDPASWKLNPLNNKSLKDLKTVFVSYSHKDFKYLERIQIHLRPLERKSLIQLWSDTSIKSGEKWKKEIEDALNKSSIALILISADFLASEFIINNELQPLLKAAEDKGTLIIPLVVKPCRFTREPSISQFQSANDPSTPLCNMTEYDQELIYEKVASRIELILESE
ncbi:toll/interleukin-1 receptor domain-containing protein [Flavobacterium dankookense]|uniref:TIR domain-containing protein n=1 Tax=Flavobacterium dankookense TaxID=706186 RepID=A0A4R6QD18_9FLAO|nr:toll/interleukin-1 receptor domain-containing protein [Flavobacterium dankookense]TDP59289.1 TIR domain-containing protein [Flavobacterium dankookense]